MPVCRKCEQVFPNVVMIDGKRRVMTTRRFCLDCSPFNHHNTKPVIDSIIVRGDIISDRVCSKCNETKSVNDFYRNKDKIHGTICKSCYTEASRINMKQKKTTALNMLGGKCIICDYCDTPEALTFHHVNPLEKDHDLTRLFTRSLENILPELSKCVILCARCHLELHHSQFADMHNTKVVEWKKAHPNFFECAE